MSKGVAFRKSAKKARVDDEAGSSARPTPAAASSSSPNQNGKGRQQQQQQPKTQRPSDAKRAAQQPLKSALKKPSGPAAARPPQKQVQLQKQRQTTSKPVMKSQPAPKAAKMATVSAPRQVAGPSTTTTAAAASTAATTTWIQPPAPQSSFRIITGSYERLLYGLQVTQTKTSSSSGPSNLSLSFTPVFQFPAHPSAIKCLASSRFSTTSKYLVTAGQDELVKIWDLRRKKEVGSLSGAESHGSPINMEFPLSSHFLLTATNVILLYRTRDWALLHTFKGHTGRVNFVATHPSAKLALSGGQDGVLRAWDLTRGKALGGTKMGMGNGGEMESLSWFGGEGKGTFFALRGRTVVRIFRKDMSEVARIGTGTLTGTRLNDVACWDLGYLKTTQDTQAAAEWKGKTLIFVAREDKKVGVYLFDRKVFDELDAKAERRAAEREAKEDEEEEDDIDAEEAEEEEQRTLEEIAWLDGHTNRVKAVSLQPLSSPQDPSKWTLTATTISSDGIVRVFDLGPLVSSSSSLPEALADGSSVLTIRPCAEHSTKGARLTCLSVVGGDGSLPSKAGDEEDDEEEEGEDAFAGFSSGEEDDDAEESDDEEIADSLDPEEKELKKLEGILREARRQGIDLDELMRVGVPDEVDIEGDDGEGSDDDEEEEEEEEETEGEDEA